jgi:hypothetical protein
MLQLLAFIDASRRVAASPGDKAQVLAEQRFLAVNPAVGQPEKNSKSA